ncbi:hypothetical protein F2Q69_00012789 [Brassica cretica]|uniref:Uncharacterized protein n=1 Tax=Brassica cretica TaxID=69181 RepID=A0A8S9R364_BRACR|nr:hypothetical protein F2Q69_00012789 [Brassica cretica]
MCRRRLGSIDQGTWNLTQASVGVKIGHDGIDVRKSLEKRISVKASKAKKTNSRNRSPGSAATRASSPDEHGRVAGRVTGELGRDKGPLARQARPC